MHMYMLFIIYIAGKTTTMKILTGDELPTNGEGFVGGRNILTDQIGARQLMGYVINISMLHV